MAGAAVPLILQGSANWAGNDGKWATYSLAIGSPPQRFHVLPSLSLGEIWLPLPQGCSNSFSGCAASRGAESTQPTASVGFQTNESSTWKQIGVYGLGFEKNLFGDGDNGLYGQDIVVGVANQTVAGISTPDFWLGRLGLGIQPAEFDVKGTLSTFLSSLKDQNASRSLSYGYGVGAYYHSDPGGLIFGGYDQNAADSTNMSFPLHYTGARSLTANLRSLVATNTFHGTGSIPVGSKGLNMTIDSTVSQIWLPESICDTLADSLGLTYDNNTELYLINSTSRSQLRNSRPEFTFTLAVDGISDETLNIVLPYAAFDLRAGLPMYNASTPYFPIRRAANETQYVLGRAFLQEAYLVVDWERMSFTMSQATHKQGVSNDIVPILPLEVSEPSQTSKKLGAAAIAGIAVVAVAAVSIFCTGVWLWRRRRSRSKWADSKKETEGYPELHCSPGVKDRSELAGAERHELHDEHLKLQLMSNPVYELPVQAEEHELE